ncbi:MAG: mucoidy inhibitor MuiA family protein [Myxococcaceae bacterium]|nr:mucoidy inhibitor MuiA family protein [Myxococcaceae bacterium]
MLALSVTMLVVTAAPRVEQVVLYPDRAQVTRAAEVACDGRTRVTFANIPPAADPQSLRASARSATVEGLRSETRPRTEAYSKERAALEADQHAVEQQLAALDDEVARAQHTASLGAQFDTVASSMISRDLATTRPDTKSWSQAYTAALQARLEAAAQVAATLSKRRALTRQLEDLQRKLARLDAAASRTELFADVIVSCRSGTARVELTYLVGGASWSPAYEARADESAHIVELSTWATVSQRTGEDWTNAKIVLSTAIPSQDATPPELEPLKVYAERVDQEKKVLVRREQQIRHAEAPAGSSADTQALGGLAARSQGLSVQLEVPKPGTVPGDGAPVRLFVGRHRLPAKFAWRAVPTLAPFVFRVADVVNTAPYPLLPGPLDAFGRTGFVGRSDQDRVAEGAPFHLTFGIEDRVKVKRVVLEELARDEGLFNQRRRYRYSYRFELANYAGQPITLELSDRVPVSELDDVLVGIDEDVTTKGFSLQRQDGVVTWKLKLAPAEKKDVTLKFHVDVPNSYDTGGI